MLKYLLGKDGSAVIEKLACLPMLYQYKHRYLWKSLTGTWRQYVKSK